MSKKESNRIGIAALLTLTLLAILWVRSSAQSGTVNCGEMSAVVTLHEGDLSWQCVTVTPTNEPTFTNISPPTETPTPSPTSTSTPSPTETETETPTQTQTPTKPVRPTVELPTVTPTPAPNLTPSADAPLCAHNPNRHHGMWNAALGCRYDHQHGDDPTDPTACDALLVSWLGAIPATISYPWQTANENTLKHDGYIKMCRTFHRPGEVAKLTNDLNWVGKTPNIVVGAYGEFHRHAGAIDRAAPTHSYQLWLYSCKVVNGAIDWTVCGSFKSGGHAHMGILHCMYKAKFCARPRDWPIPANHLIPGIGMDTSGTSLDPYVAIIKPISTTLRSLSGYPLGWRDSGIVLDGEKWTLTRYDNNTDVADLWTTGAGIYGGDSAGRGYNWNNGFAIQSFDDPDSVRPDAYDAVIAAGGTVTEAFNALNAPICQYAPAGSYCRFDGSEHVIFTAYSLTPWWWDGSALDLDGARDGFVTMGTYADLRGNPSTTCTAASSVCVPLVLDRSPVGWAGHNEAVGAYPNGRVPGNLRDYNLYRLPIENH